MKDNDFHDPEFSFIQIKHVIENIKSVMLFFPILQTFIHL